MLQSPKGKEYSLLPCWQGFFCKGWENTIFFHISSKCGQPSSPPFHLYFSWLWLFTISLGLPPSGSTKSLIHYSYNTEIVVFQEIWMIYFCETYFVLGCGKIRRLDLFFFMLKIPCPKSGCFFLGVWFYLGETFLIFEVMTEKAENKIYSLIKLLIIIKRDL